MSLNAWRTYLAERFPVPVTLMLALATGAASYAVVQTPVVRAGFDLTIDASQLGGCVALMFLLLFHLRVFDEHKDYAQDAATRPDRPVQRGLVTLDQLKVAGALTIALELVIAFAPGARAGAWWLLPLGYSVLMLFEFFVPHWLERHYGIYAVSHSAITSLVCVALVMRFAVPGFVPTPELVGLAVLALASTFSIDVLRKTWMPASEIDGVASWSKLVGVSRAAWLGSFLIALAGVCAAWLGWRLGGRWGWIGFVAAITGWGVATIRGFAAKPTAKGEKMLQVVAGIHYLVVWTGIAVVAAIANGARWYL
jgi:hypothetical protein